MAKRIENLEMDEFWSFVGKKADQRWTWYGFDRERKQVVASVNGRRTDANCRALYEKVKRAKVGAFHTDQWAAYPKVLPEKKHQIGKEGTLRHRAAKLDLSHQDQALAATNDLFFKERSDARCGDEITYSSLESSASSNLKHD